MALENPFENVTLNELYLYNQYASADWLKIFFKQVDKQTQSDFIDTLGDYFDAFDIKNSESDFLTYYTRNYLGMNRPLGGASVGQYYDTGIAYDSMLTQEKQLIYDDSANADGLITQEQYLKFIKFVYDYSIECLNILDLIQFVASYNNIETTDIRVEYSLRTIKIYLPQTDECIDFIKMVILESDALVLPFGESILDFQIDYSSGATE